MKLSKEQERIKTALIKGTANDSPTVVVPLPQLLKLYTLQQLITQGLLESEETEIPTTMETPLRRRGRLNRGGPAVSEREEGYVEVNRELLRDLLGA